MTNLRRKIESVVLDVLKDIGVPPNETSPDAGLLEIMLDEDATFWFVPAIERRLKVKIPISEWERVVTISDTIEMLERHVHD